MSANNPSSNVPYDPLPLTADDHNSTSLYNAPQSPGPQHSTFTPQNMPRDLPAEDSAIPPGAAQPRFMGQALYGPGSPGMRDSFASSQHTFPNANSEYTSSVYALNDTGYTGGYKDDPRDFHPNEHGSVPMVPIGATGRMLNEKNNTYAAPRSKSRRKLIILAAIGGLILIAVAVFVPVYFLVIKNDNEASGSSSSGSNGKPGGNKGHTSAATPSATAVAVTGGHGSTVLLDDGTEMTYENNFGGTWYWDENDPFNNGARAQSWSPALNETFHYGTDKIRGVNLGGWLNTEPFISPALYEKYAHLNPRPVDEYTLSEAMAADVAGGGLSQLEDHYKTFITERDFAEIAAAGLNWVRIPIAYWIIEKWDGEPFLEKVSWEYFLKAIKWARKYGLRINLDLHALPGSQNGWNHSGRLGTVNWLNGPMGYANAQRSLDYIRIIAEFISQPQYRDVVPMFGIVNEPQGSVTGYDALARFYTEAYRIIREAGGTGEGNGPWISIHDGFFPRTQWASYMPNGDRLSLDTHPYLCFNEQSDAPMSTYATTPCTTWGSLVNSSMATFGLTNAGEFSNAVTDCGLFLNGVGLGTRYEGTYQSGSWPRQGSCEEWTDYQNYSPAMKTAIRQFALASMDALQDYFFWTWKIGNSSESGKVETPAWSYQLGLQEGWMPLDPREATGTCGYANVWQPPLQPWQTGGVGAGVGLQTAAIAWPPASLSNAGDISTLPSFTATGAIPTLTPPTFTITSGRATSTADAGSGWNNPADTVLAHVPIATCTYLDFWVGPTAAVPPVCGSGSVVRRAPAPAPIVTPPPAL